MKKDDLKRIINYEYKIYFPTKKDYIRGLLLREHEYIIWKYQKILRKEEYATSNNKRIYKYFLRIRRNRLGCKLGFFIPPNVFSEGLRIWHYGNIVVNGSCHVGKNCILHGDNCIGNNGDTENKCPIIGDNVDIGTGAKIIGDVIIGDNVIIGAGAVVVKSVESNETVGGVPAKSLK